MARLDVFGSAVGGVFDPEGSDIDFFVEFTDPSASSYADDYFGLKEALEAVFDRRVDLITRPSVRNPYLLARIEATGELVYSSTSGAGSMLSKSGSMPNPLMPCREFDEGVGGGRSRH